MNPAAIRGGARRPVRVWAFVAAAAAALICGPAIAADVLKPAPGRATAHDSSTINALRHVGCGKLASVTQPKAAPLPLAPPRTRAAVKAVPGGTLDAKHQAALAASEPSPEPLASFAALGDNQTVIPPDSNGAAGPNHLMAALNSEILFQYRTGVEIARMPLGLFWAGLNGTNPDPYCPRTVYDPYGGRFIFTCAANPVRADSALLVAVSQTGDATGSWHRYLVDADALDTHFADAPSIGFTKDRVIVQVNMFPIAGTGAMYSNIYVFDKADLYSGGAGLYSLFRDDTGFTQVPALTYDDSLDTAYLLEEYSESASGQLRLSSITGPLGQEVFNRGIAYPTGPLGWDFVSATGQDCAPQPDSDMGLDTGDARLTSLVYRDGSLWTCHTVFLPQGESSRSSVQWWQIGLDGAVLQRGLVDDPGGAEFFAYPSIAVNRNQDVLIGYSRFSETRYASAGYSFRESADAPGTLRAAALLKEGLAPYYKVYDGLSNRWGDYSTAMVDPINDVDFWTIQQYADDPLEGVDRWGTWWGRIPGPQPKPENDECGGARVIEALPAVTTVSTRSATSTGDPSVPCVPAFGKGVWFSYQADTNGLITADTVGSDFDTGLAVFAGACGSLAQVACDDDSGGGDGAARVMMNVYAGTTYFFLAGGYHAEGGQLKFRIQSATPAILDFFPEMGAVGTSVDINGSSFFGATSVEFNGIPDPTAVVDSASHISARVPAGATTGPITVTTPGGTAVSETDFIVVPSIYIDDTSAIEGDSGTSSAVFTVHLSARAQTPVTVAFTTADGTAEAGEDYRTAEGSVTFPPNSDTALITVTIIGDTLEEENEHFFVNLSNPVGGVLTDHQAQCTLTDNDSDQPVVIGEAALVLAESCVPGNLAIDPDERVTVELTLKNIGPTATENLVATLLPSAGVSNPGVAQEYGALDADGGTGTKPFSFTAKGTCGSSFAAILKLTDGDKDLGNATFSFVLGPVGAASVFTSEAAIAIPTSGKADPYPSSIEVSGMPGTVSRMTVSLNSVNHLYPDDLDILLVGPSGQTVVLMSDCGGSYDLVNTTITFDDSAPAPAPDSAAMLTGSYKPANYTPADSFPLPAPLQPYGATLSAFSGLDPNGLWSLYVFDDATGTGGSIAQGWSLSITTGTQMCCRLADLALTKSASPDPVTNGSKLTYTLTVTNLGPSQATHVVVTDPLPANSEFVVATPSQGTAVLSDGIVACDMGTVEAGAQARLTIVVKPTLKAPLTNTATVTSADPDPVPGNNASTTVTQVGDPALVIEDMTVAEGHSGVTSANFVVSLSAPTDQEVRVDYATEDITALAGSDYGGVNGQLVLGGSITRVTVPVAIYGDRVEEPSEIFAFVLSSPVNAAIIDDGEGVCSIRNDDTPPAIDSVEISPLMCAAGETMQVSAHATDDYGVASVTAGAEPLVSTGGGYWEGFVDVDPVLGAHPLEVVATDTDGNSVTNSEGSYRTVPSVIIRNSAAAETIVGEAWQNFLFTVMGRVTVLDAGSFLLDDGSPRKVIVRAIGHTLQTGDLAKARGVIDQTTNPPTLNSSLERIEKLF